MQNNLTLVSKQTGFKKVMGKSSTELHGQNIELLCFVWRLNFVLSESVQLEQTLFIKAKKNQLTNNCLFWYKYNFVKNFQT